METLTMIFFTIPICIIGYEVFKLFEQRGLKYSINTLLVLVVSIVVLTLLAGKMILIASLFIVPMILPAIITFEKSRS